ncbi:MAG: NYN domain-containing protein [Rhodospirillales bacterium]
MQGLRRGIFIDGSNLYSAAKHLGFDVDYRRLLDFFAGGSWLVRAYYYTAIAEDQEYSPVRPLADWLDYNGFTLISKSAKEFVDPAGRRRIRGNMDVEITVDALTLADKLDHIILMSGDGDFRRLVEAIQQKGVRVTVVSTVRTNPPMIADELRRQADEFIDLLEIAPEIERRVPDRGEAQRTTQRREEKFARQELDDQPLRGPGDFRDDGYLDDDEVD